MPAIPLVLLLKIQMETLTDSAREILLTVFCHAAMFQQLTHPSFQIFPDSLECRIKSRCKYNPDQSGQEHHGKGRNTDGSPAPGAGTRDNHQRKRAEQAAQRGHQHCAAAKVCPGYGCLKYTFSAFPFLFGELHHRNGIFRRKPISISCRAVRKCSAFRR